MIETIVKEGTFKGEAIKNKEDLYRKLSVALYVSYDTVKGWTRQSSKGPGDKEVLKDIENLLNTKLTIKDEEKKVVEETEVNKSYSSFVKEKIYTCYKLMAEYLTSDDVEDENAYCDMRNEIIKMKVCIPKEIFDKITKFAEDHLEPIIYDRDNFFADMYTEEFGYMDENHCFHIKDEDAIHKQAGIYYTKLFDLTDQLEEFGMKEIYPILTA